MIVIKAVPIERIKPNPYRDTKLNPIIPEKIEHLGESIESTGLWIGICGRELPNGDVELSFGHSRLEAAKKLGIKEIPVVIEKLSDSDMLMRMARENSDTQYGPLVMMESVAGTVRALGEGKISLPELDPSTRKEYIRYAPSFTAREPVPGVDARPYTVESIATFLGYVKKGSGRAKASVTATFTALELLEKKVIETKDVTPKFDKLGEAMSSVKKRHEELNLRQKHSAAEIAAIHEQQALLDAKRRAAEQKEKELKFELQKKEAEARKEEDEKEARRISEQRKREDERTAAREEAFKEARARLDAKVKEAEERAEEAKKQDKNLPTKHAVSTCLFKLKTTISERNSFRDELKSLARNKDVNQAERENIRQALLACASWYEEQAIYFRPIAQKAAQ